MRESLVFYAVNLAAWAATVGLVELAERIFGTSTALQINLASLAATAIILIPKFASYRDLVFKKALGEGKEDKVAPGFAESRSYVVEPRRIRRDVN